MRTINLDNGHSLSLYQSIHELPAGRHTEMQCYLVQDAGIGSTMASVGQHFARLHQFLAAGRVADAADEAVNLHYNFNFALEKFSTESLAFGCLVAQVDGAAFTDTSEEGIRMLLQRLSGYGLTTALVAEELETVKKKLLTN